jgi:signal transduction histidine kinase
VSQLDSPLDSPRSPQSRARSRREARTEFLVGANDLLRRITKLIAAGLDEEATLASVARLTLPYSGTWSLLEVRANGSPRRVLVSNRFPCHLVATKAFANGWPTIHDRPGAAARVIRRERSELIPALTDPMLLEIGDSPEQFLLLRELEIGSALTVTLSTGTEMIGTLTFFSPRSGRTFDDSDRLLAEDVAVGAGVAIANSRLAATRAQSEAATRSLASEHLAFICGLSHGLRTPLHAIHGYAHLLADGVRGPLNVGQQKDVQRIQANERHLLSVVDSVISFARWDDGEALVLEDIAVRRAVRQSSPVVVRAAIAKGIEFEPQPDALDAALVVRAEPRRLREILVQLMLNAVKFSRTGDTVSVSALAVGDRIWIRVTDTGVGIAKQYQESIFQPFGHGDHDGVDNGVGLGLAVTQKLARAMGGELSVTSEPGRGSTFTLALPRGRLP